MRFFGERGRGLGREDRDMLLERLQAMDSTAMNWGPLRYSVDAGQGWAFIAENIEKLRHRLLVENPEKFYGFDPKKRPKAL